MREQEIKSILLKESIETSINNDFTFFYINGLKINLFFLDTMSNWIFGFVCFNEILLLLFLLSNLYYISRYWGFFSFVPLSSRYTKFSLKLISLKLLKKLNYQIIILLICSCLNFFFITNIYFFYNNLFTFNFFILLTKILLLLFWRSLIKLLINTLMYHQAFFSLENIFILYNLIFFSCLILQSNNLFLTFLLLEVIFFCILVLFFNKFYNKSQLVFKNFLNSASQFWQIIVTNYTQISIHSILIYFIYNLFFVNLFMFAMSIYIIYLPDLQYATIFSFSYTFLKANTIYPLTCYTFQNIIILFSTFLLLILIVYKLGIFPFHAWLFNILLNINFLGLFIILINFKIIIFFLCFRFFYGIFMPIIFLLKKFFLILIALSLIYSSIGLYNQVHIRKFLVYSTINNSSYILIGLLSNTQFGYFSTIIYILIYLLSIYGFLLFITTSQVIQKRSFITFFDLQKILQKSIITLFFIIIIFSMIGLPPFAGFWVKIYMIQILLFEKSLINLSVLIIIILTSTLITISYLRIIKIFYMNFKSEACKKSSISIEFPDYIIFPLAKIVFLLLGYIPINYLVQLKYFQIENILTYIYILQKINF